MSSIKITTKEGKEYILEYNKKTVVAMQRDGFDLKDIEAKPNIAIPALFKGAFLAHHRYIKADEVDAIYDGLKKKGELINTLIEMYYEPVNALFSEEDEDEEGNGGWEVSR